MEESKSSKIIDISLPIHPDSLTYPGNPTTEFDPQKSSTGNTITKIKMGSHTGTHIDAPSHAIEGAETIDSFPLDIFIGLCRVLDLTSVEKGIEPEDLGSKNIKKGERILLKTKNSKRGFDKFYEDFVFLSSKGAQYLVQTGPILVGIDYLSIKQKGSLDNTSHTAILTHNIPIVEGLDLSGVDEGEYELICMPLKFIGIDGSPARAVLIK